MPKILKHKILLNNQELFFFAPENDSTIPGTLAGLKENNWKLEKTNFQDGDYFVDIGCNVGLISLIVAKLKPNINVLSYDPNPIAIDCLKMAIQENGINNIRAINKAVGGKPRPNAEFFTYAENETCLIEKSISSNQREVSYFVDVISIDEIFDKEIKGNVKFLKCDIECGEFELFDYLFDYRPDILNRIDRLSLEIHPLWGEERSDKLRNRIDALFGDRVSH